MVLFIFKTLLQTLINAETVVTSLGGWKQSSKQRRRLKDDKVGFFMHNWDGTNSSTKLIQMVTPINKAYPLTLLSLLTGGTLQIDQLFKKVFNYLKKKWQEKLKSRLLAKLPHSPQIPSSFLLEGKEVQNPSTLQKGDPIAVAWSTATRTRLQLKLIKSPSQIFFYCHCISKICWSHQLIQRLCLKGGKKLHSFPSSRWCEHCRAQWEHSWRGKWRPCGTGSGSPISIALNLVINKAAMSGILTGILPLVYNTKAVANA